MLNLGNTSTDAMRHTQPRHISFTRLSHSLAKILALFCLLITVGIGNAWGWDTNVYLNGNFTGNNWNNASYQFTWWYNSTDGKYYMPVYATGSAQYFRLWTNNHVGPSSNNSEIDETSGGEQASSYDEHNWKYIGDAGIINICIDQTGGKDWKPWVWIERPTIKFKHPWNGAVSWTEVSATDNRDGTYQYKGQYGGTAGFNAGPSADLKYKESATTVTGSPSTGDYCLFKWNASGYKHNTGEGNDYGTFTITKLCTITYDANGATDGDVPADQEDILYNTATTVRGNTGSLVKTGYTFGGWNTEPDGTGTTYAAGSGSISPTDVTTTLYAMWGREFTLVTSSDLPLNQDDEIIILNTGGTKALSTTQKDNNRDATTNFSINSNKVVIPDESTVQVIAIEQEDAENNKYSFYVGDGETDSYLCAGGSGSGKNYLYSKTKANAGDNGVWKIAIDGSSKEATVTAQGTATNNLLKNNSNLFSCYASGQTAIKLYRCTSPYQYLYYEDLNFSYVVGYGPSLADSVSIKAYNLTGSLTVTCPSGYELSGTSATSGFSTSNLTFTKDAKNRVAATFYIRLKAGNSTGSYDNTISISGGGVAPAEIDLEGTVSAAPSGTAYKLVTNSVNLFPDDEIVIMNAAGTYMMSTTQNTNNRGAISSGFTATSTAVFVTSEDAQNITLEKCDNEWLFKVGDNRYLYAGAKSNNYLKTSDKSTADNGNGNWKAEIDEQTGIALIFAPNSTDRRDTMQYNSEKFACYKEEQSGGALKLYAKASATANVCGYPSALTLTSTYGSASTAQSFTVKARNITSGNVTVSAPTGYEVCLTENGTYAASVTLTPVSNSVAPTTVYVRLKNNNNAGSVDGNISISATGATTRTIALSGTVAKATPTFIIDATIELALRGSSVVKEDLFLSESNGTCTLTFDTSGGGDDGTGVTFSQEDNTLTFERTGSWDITISQAATDNYFAVEEEFLVDVTCGTPFEPENLAVSDILSRSATLSWDAVDGADHYILYVTDLDEYELEVDDIDGETTSYELDNLSPGVTYSWTLNVENSCREQLETEVNGEDFTTPFAVTYHSATEDDYIVYNIASGGNVATEHYSSYCAADRVFVGWSTEAVSVQQSEPTIETEDGTLTDVTANVDLYAVFANRSGGKVTDSVTVSEGFETYSTGGYTGTNNKFSNSTTGLSWIIDYGNVNTTGASIFSSVKDVVLKANNGTSSNIRSSSPVDDVISISLRSARNNASIGGSLKWTTDTISWPGANIKVLSISKNESAFKDSVYFKHPQRTFIKIANTNKVTDKYLYIDSIVFTKAVANYYYTDYSTTCTSGSATITWENNSGVLASGTQPTDTTIRSWKKLPTLTRANYRFDGWKATINGSLKSDVYEAGEWFLIGHDVTLTAQWTRYIEDIDGVSPITTGNGIAVRSYEVDSIVVNSASANTPTANKTGTDASLFAVTIDAANKRVADGKTHIPYYVTYTPTEYNVTNSVDITFTCDGVESSAITVRGRSLPEEFVIAVKKGDGTWVALPNDLASTLGDQKVDIVPIEIVVDNTTTPTSALLAPTNTVYKTTAKKNASHVTSLRFTVSGSNYLRSTTSNDKLCLATSNYDDEDWTLQSSNFEAYQIAFDPTMSSTRVMGLYTSGGKTYMGHPVSASATNTDIYFLPIETKAPIVEVTVTTWSQHHLEVTLAEALGSTANGATATLGATSDDATEISDSGTQYSLTFDDLDFTDKSGEQLVIIWKNGSTVLGGSRVIAPSIVAPSAEQDSWSDITATASDIVVLNQTTTVDVTDAVAKAVVLTNESQLIINANKALVVTGKITREDGTPTHPEDLIIQSSAAGNGTLIFENDGDSATVQMYSKATQENQVHWQWQWIATPVDSIPSLSFYGSYLYEWPSDATGWNMVTRGDTLTIFTGYTLSNKKAGSHEIKGMLAPTTSKNITVPAGKDMVIGNSWTAPIQITQMDEDDFVNVEQTIYLFNTGMDSEEQGAGAADAGDRYKAGTYVTIPINETEDVGVSKISSLQGFYVTNSTGSAGSLTLSYSKHIRPTGTNTVDNGAMHAPKRTEEKPIVLKMWASGSRYDDRLILVEREDFSIGFDNGWDGKKLDEPGDQPMLYTTRPDGTKDAVSALPELDGTVIAFRAGEDESYTLRFEYNGENGDASLNGENGENDELYLYDIVANKYAEVVSGNTYTFTTTDKEEHGRFILTRNYAPQITTDVEPTSDSSLKGRAKKMILEQKFYIYRNGVLYDGMGRIVCR